MKWVALFFGLLIYNFDLFINFGWESKTDIIRI